MIRFRIWLATHVVHVSNAFLQLATKLTPTHPDPDELYAAMADEAQEHGEPYDAPYYLQHFHREKGGVVSLRPMSDSEGEE